ncbi:MAG: hypothetical protein ACYCVD_06965 [Desulfitobacteriaceae bacterium]
MSNRRRKSFKHLSLVFVGTFIIAGIAGGSAELLMKHTSLLVAWLFLLVIILIHIIFDVIGIAATAATEVPHHARAANRVYGAKQAVALVRNADLVANFANDIVGDVTGTLSGAMAASIVIDAIRYYPRLAMGEVWVNTGMLALVASVTVTGKALGKSFAMHEANEIMATVGRILATIERITGLSFTGRKKRGGKKHGSARKNS